MGIDILHNEMSQVRQSKKKNTELPHPTYRQSLTIADHITTSDIQHFLPAYQITVCNMPSINDRAITFTMCTVHQKDCFLHLLPARRLITAATAISQQPRTSRQQHGRWP